MKNQSLTIAGLTIKQDANGRFRLNDLHKASGGEKRHSPNYFLSLDSTIELINELKSSTVITVVEQNQELMREPIEVINGGNKQGTYVCKQLVYAYAMWVSAKFHLHVIESFDALVMAERKEFEWLLSRGATKQDYKRMTNAIKDAYIEKHGIPPKCDIYASDADMLNLIVLGMTSKQYKLAHGLDDKAAIRDYLNAPTLDALDYLETTNSVFLDDGLELHERARKLQVLFNKKFKQKIIDAMDNDLIHLN